MRSRTGFRFKLISIDIRFSLPLRVVQAREYLYYKLTGEQLTTPVAIMTSDAKGNHQRILGLMERSEWFGRGEEAFRLFRQPLVPVLALVGGAYSVLVLASMCGLCCH